MGLKISTSKIIAIAISFLLSFLLFWAAWEGYSEHNSVKRYEGRAIGHVTNKHLLRGSDGNTTYYLDYEFSISGGKIIKSTGSVSQTHWDVLKVNDTLKVRYDQSKPDHNLPMGSGSSSLFYVFFIFLLGVVFLAFGVISLISSVTKGSNNSDKI